MNAPAHIHPDDTPTQAQIDAYVARDIPVDFQSVFLPSVELGLKGRHIDFSWRPYAKRSKTARADYDRLVVSIFHHGIKAPLITHKGHVLIGQRRAEIALAMGKKWATAWEVLEDVTEWWSHDLPRLERLKKQIGEVEY